MPDNRAQATSLTNINKMIGNIARSANKLNETIHNCAVMCFEHAHNYGDCDPAARLVDAMPKSHRRSLLINWFETYSPVRIAKSAKTDAMKGHLSGKADANKGEDGFRDWDIEGAKATPFYAMPEAQREPDVPTYESIHENIVAFVKRMKTKAEKIEDDKQKNHALAEVALIENAIPNAVAAKAA